MSKILSRKQTAERCGFSKSKLDRVGRLTPPFEAAFDPKFSKPLLGPTGRVKGWREREIISYLSGGKLPVHSCTGAAVVLDEARQSVEVTYQLRATEFVDLVAQRVIQRLALDAKNGQLRTILGDFAKLSLIDDITIAVEQFHKLALATPVPQPAPKPAPEQKQPRMLAGLCSNNVVTASVRHRSLVATTHA